MSTQPLPPVHRDHASGEFFDATARRLLVLRRCSDCDHVRGPEIAMCTLCTSELFTWFQATGTGRVASWVVLHGRGDAEGVVPAARVVATVELAEGPWITSALLDVDPEMVTGGMEVRVAFEQPDGGEAIPVFRPSAGTVADEGPV